MQALGVMDASVLAGRAMMQLHWPELPAALHPLQ